MTLRAFETYGTPTVRPPRRPACADALAALGVGLIVTIGAHGVIAQESDRPKHEHRPHGHVQPNLVIAVEVVEAVRAQDSERVELLDDLLLLAKEQDLL